MIDEACRGALAFGARDADGLGMELTEEQVGLRGNLHPFRVKILERDAWCFDDDVIIIHRLQIACAKILHTLHFVLVGHRHNGIRQVFVQETQS